LTLAIVVLQTLEPRADCAGASPAITINRGTGQVTLANLGDAPFRLVRYSIASDRGALDASAWKSFAENYDGDSGGLIDDNNWLSLTAPNGRFELSEAENPTGDGASISASQLVNLGNAWIRQPVEDVTAELIFADGTILPATINFEGGEAYKIGDLNLDRAANLTIADWVAFKGNHGFDYATVFSAAESYQKADLDADFDHDLDDFAAFKTAYDVSNGGSASGVSTVLTLEVNTANGNIRLLNKSSDAVPIDAYRIRSAAGVLNRDAWWGNGPQPAALNGGQSIHDQPIGGFPRGIGTGNGWEEGPGSTNKELVEWFLGAVGGNPPAGQGSSTLMPGQAVTLNGIFQVGGMQDIQFDYRSGGMTLQGVVEYVGATVGVSGDFNGNGVVDAADYVLWRNGGPLQNDPTSGIQLEDYDTWRASFGRSGGSGSSLSGSAAVPEPASWLLALFVPSLLYIYIGRGGARRRPVSLSQLKTGNPFSEGTQSLSGHAQVRLSALLSSRRYT
jgi:hypothetical protein